MPDDKRARLVLAPAFAGQGGVLSKPGPAASGASGTPSSGGWLCPGREVDAHAGGAGLMTAQAGAAMQCSCPGRRSHGKGDGLVPQSGGGGASATGLRSCTAEQRGAASQCEGLEGDSGTFGAFCAARVFCRALCLARLSRQIGAFQGVFSPALAGRAAQKGKVRGTLCVHKIKHNEFQ